MQHADPLVIREVDYGHPDRHSLDDEVQDYYVSIYGAPDATPIAADEFAPPRGAFFVAYVDEVAVAMGGWRLTEPIDGHAASRPAEIKRMYVVQAARRRGVARALLAHLEQTARVARADAIVLETGQVQPDAVSLYRACGYADIPRFGYYAAEEMAVHLGKML